MINLSGSTETDRIMTEELKIARIPAFTGIVEKYGEVNARTVGLLGFDSSEKGIAGKEAIDFLTRHPTKVDSLSNYASFVFTRLWYYYSVQGFVPEDVAWEIYNHPDNIDSRYKTQGNIIRVDGHCGPVKPEAPWLTKHKIAGKHCIQNYHIDSQLGLNTFVDIVTKNGLI